jgi:type I restriction enzyme, S subunit
MIKTIPNEKLLSKKYLYYILTGAAFQNFISTIGARAAQAGFNKDDLSYFKFHLPTSLVDQDKIISVLEKAQNNIKLKEKSLHLLDELLQMKFLELFGDPIKNEKGWETKSITELVKKEKYSLKRGPFGGALKKEIFVSEGYLVYEQYHALNNDFSFERYYIDEDKFQELKAFEVRPGDIIISCSGVYLGKLAILPSYAKRGIINQALLKVSLDQTKMNNEYFIFLFSQDSFKIRFFGDVRGSGIPNFPPMEEFKNFRFIYPPIEQQNNFDKIVQQVKKLKGLIQQSRNTAQELYNSLYNKAFNGKLDIISKITIDGTISIEPKVSGEAKAVNKINIELEEFHKQQQHTGAPAEIDNKIRQVEAELKIRGEIPFWDEYVKYRIVKEKFKGAFTFEQLWQEITKFPFETLPEYDEVSCMIFKWLEEDQPFLQQSFNKEKNQIELTINETAEA